MELTLGLVAIASAILIASVLWVLRLVLVFWVVAF